MRTAPHRRTRRRTVLVGLVLALLSAGLVRGDVASAYWSTGSVANGRGAAAATSVGAGQRPTATATGSSVALTWAASTLASGQAVSGYLVERYDAVTGTPDDVEAGTCAGLVTSTSCSETAVPDGRWVFTVTPVIGTSWQGTESPTSVAVLVDVTAPGSTLSLTAVSGGATLSGTTVYYRGSTAGSLRLVNTVTDTTSGPASSRTTALDGTTTGWSHTASTVTTPAGGPYTSNPFSWTAGTTSSPTVQVVTADAAGNLTSRTLTFVSDTDAPTGTISYADGYSSGRSVTISFTATPSGSAIATTQLQRSRASLRGGSCGTFGAYADLGPANAPSPYTDGPGTAGACYQYRLIVTDAVGNTGTATSTNVARLGYAGAVQATGGLVSYWRFGESAATSTDSFTGVTGVALQDRDGESGATWTRHPSTGVDADAVLTAAGRLRKEGRTTSALYYGSGVPLSADYRVSADVVVTSEVAGERVGVVGRLDTAAATYYTAYYDRAAARWQLAEVVGGTSTSLGTFAEAVPAGATRRVALDLSGQSIRLLVNGSVVVSATSGAIAAAGRGGVLLSGSAATDLTDATGTHLDNYLVGPVDAVPASTDSRGTNTGTYAGGVTLGQTGVLAGDSDTAARFDGSDDYMQVASPTGLPTGASVRTVELWFKTSAATRQVLYSYGNRAANAEFALWLNAGGGALTAWGYGPGSDKTFTPASPLNDGAWHLATTTYDGTNLAVWIDGVRLGTQAATRATTIDSYGFSVGAITNPNDANSGGYFNGVIDEVAVYSTVLSGTTIADHYALANPYQDVDGPTGGSVDGTNLVGASGRYRSTTALTLGLSKGSDPSGVAGTGAQLQRATATLSYNTCGVFGAYSAVATDPPASLAQTVASGSCYRYRYVVPDTLGNTTTYASPSIKVDTSAPAAPTTPTASQGTNAYVAGATVWYRAAAPTGSFTVTTTGTDTLSAVPGLTFPSLGAGWTSGTTTTTVGATVTTASTVYSWGAANPTAPGSKTITATNGAGLVSPVRSVTFTNDATAPSGGGISYADGRTTATSTTLTLTLGSDTQSGITSTKSIQMSTAPASGGVCGTFGAFTEVTTTTSTATSSTLSRNLTADTCHKFQYVVTDRVGNQTVYTSTNVVRRAAAYNTTVTGTTGILDYWRLGEPSGATTAADSYTTGGTNNGAYNGAPTLGVAGSGALNGDTNTAVTFNGTNQYVSMNRGLTGTNLSVEFWFRSTQANGGSGAQWWNAAALVDADVSGVANDFGIGLSSDGRVVAGVGGTSDTSIRSGAGLNDDAWHHVVFTRTQTGGALVLYVDGAQVATGTGGTGTLTASATMTLGRAAGGGLFYAGSLDEVATYNAVLTAAQVTAHYNAGK